MALRAGELAMTARDLAFWTGLDARQTVEAALMDEMVKPARLKNGAPTNYALGIGSRMLQGTEAATWGAVAGYVSSNTVWLDQGLRCRPLQSRRRERSRRYYSSNRAAAVVEEKIRKPRNNSGRLGGSSVSCRKEG